MGYCWFIAGILRIWTVYWNFRCFSSVLVGKILDCRKSDPWGL